MAVRMYPGDRVCMISESHVGLMYLQTEVMQVKKEGIG